jgi:Kef-type K+ transport system membrane component KefB
MVQGMSFLLILGSAILFAFAAGKTVDRFRMPLVVGYIIAGALLGKSFLNVLNPAIVKNMGIVNDLALGIIALIIGGELNFLRLKKLGKIILFIAVCESLGAFLLVSLGIYLLTRDINAALVLGAISSATAPAATVSVINQYKARGPLTTTILGVVGIDDGMALMVYVFVATFVSSFFSLGRISPYRMIITPFKEIFLSLGIGAGFGVILSYFLNRVKSKKEFFCVALGFFLVAEGVALQWKLSELLLIMAMATVTTNLSPRKFSSIMEYLELIGFPIVAAFFCLGATRLDIKVFPEIGLIGIGYLIFRLLGKYLGATFGAVLSKAPLKVRKYIGFSLWPQIGVAFALAIMVERDFGLLGKQGSYLALLAVNTLLFTTIFTEILGPLATRFALMKAGEIKRSKI